MAFGPRICKTARMTIAIEPFAPAHLPAVLDLSMRSWEPVFAALAKEMPPYIYRAFWPDGWRTRQAEEVAQICRDRETDVHVALDGNTVVGFVGIRLHSEDSMGEIYIVAVDPDHQRKGIGQKLIDFALERMRAEGCAIAMVETSGDSGHAPARAAYEQAGFSTWPIARYFREL